VRLTAAAMAVTIRPARRVMEHQYGSQSVFVALPALKPMPRRLVQLVLLLVVASAGLNLARQVQSAMPGIWPGSAGWVEPPLALDEDLSKLLGAAAAALPEQATILLVTPGRDVRHGEYLLFHRALYQLTPRAVWWVAPAPADGTWESRWWLSAPSNTGSLMATAREKHATHILIAGSAPAFPPGTLMLATDAGSLFQLNGNVSPASGRPSDEPRDAWPLTLAAALVVPWLIGDRLLALLTRAGGVVERAGPAWLIGAGVTSLAMLWLNAAGLTLQQQLAVISAAAITGMLWRRPVGRLNLTPMQHSAESLLTRLRLGIRAEAHSPLKLAGMAILTMLLALQILVVAISAIGQPLHGWDSWVSWGMKARAIFLSGGITPTVYLDPTRAATHLDYPLLLPLVEAWLYSWLGTTDDRWVGILSLLFYLALLAVSYRALRRWSVSRSGALVPLVGIATLTPLAGAAGAVYADVPLAALVTLTAIYLVEWLSGAPRWTLLVAALAGGLMPWTKREGWLLVIALCTAAFVCTRDGRRALMAAGALVFGALLLAGPWYAFVTLNGVSNTDFMPLTLQTFVEQFNRLPSIVWHELLIGLEPVWNFIWLLTGALLLYRARTLSAYPSTLLPVSALLYIMLFSAAYLFSAYVPFQQHVLTSAYRLLAQVAPLCILWLARESLSRDA
jgi:hypothetical protein